MKKIIVCSLLFSIQFLSAMSGKGFKETSQTYEFETVFSQSELPLNEINKVVIDGNVEVTDAQKKEEILKALRHCKYKMIQNSNGQLQKEIDLSPLHKLVSQELQFLKTEAKIAGPSGFMAGLMVAGLCAIVGTAYFIGNVLSR